MNGTFDIFGLGADPERPEESPARKAQRASARSLPARFYEKVEIVEKDGFLLHLDGRPAKTPAQRVVRVRKRLIAEALADEWCQQVDVVNPVKMPLTRLVNSALDGVSSTMKNVREELWRFSGNDLICYRADEPKGLQERHRLQWDPIIEWAERTYNCKFNLTSGFNHVNQPELTKQRMRQIIERFEEPLHVAALHSATTLLGSILLVLAMEARWLTMEEAWQAAHIDEEWNQEQWGRDKEAQARQAYRFEEMKAAALVLGSRRSVPNNCKNPDPI